MKAVPPNRYVLFFSIAVAGCLIDLVTKQLVFNRLGMPGESPTRWLVHGVLGIQTSLNEGALFGFGQGLVIGFVILSIAAAAGILYWLFIAGAAEDPVLTVALGAITAGILGNLYDRLGLPGLVWDTTTPLHQAGEPVYAVRDWILVMIGRWPWPNFNVADSLLVCGSATLLWHIFQSREEETADEEETGTGEREKRSAAGHP
jgi:signal peptidase II